MPKIVFAMKSRFRLFFFHGHQRGVPASNTVSKRGRPAARPPVLEGEGPDGLQYRVLSDTKRHKYRIYYGIDKEMARVTDVEHRSDSRAGVRTTTNEGDTGCQPSDGH